jgi:hypothetical protein
VLHLEALFPETSPRGRLLDAATAVAPDHLDGSVLHPPVRIGERFVAVLRDTGAPGRARVVALDRDGALVWARNVTGGADPPEEDRDAPTAARVRDLADGTRIDVEIGTTRTTLRVLDGAVLARSGLPPGEATTTHGQADSDLPEDGAHTFLTVADGVAVREGPALLQVRGPGGERVSVRGTSPTLVATDPVVVRDGTRLLGLRVGGRS